VISIGHNPGTNHPRMMGTLHELARRGVPIIVFNPLKERWSVLPTRRMLSRWRPWARQYRLDLFSGEGRGDAAALKGIAKALLQMEEEQGNVLDRAFITEHTQNGVCR
jgi:anaerobic selenocysteine-containing dehydrogenase